MMFWKHHAPVRDQRDGHLHEAPAITFWKHALIGWILFLSLLTLTGAAFVSGAISCPGCPSLTATRATNLDNLDAAISTLPSAVGVWAAATRTLTADTNINVWDDATRTLTDITGTPRTSLVGADATIWGTTTRTLSGFTGTPRSDLVGADATIWGTTTRTLSGFTGTPRSDLVSTDATVWNTTTRTLSGITGTPRSDLVGSDATIWSATTRTITIKNIQRGTISVATLAADGFTSATATITAVVLAQSTLNNLGIEGPDSAIAAASTYGCRLVYTNTTTITATCYNSDTSNRTIIVGFESVEWW